MTDTNEARARAITGRFYANDIVGEAELRAAIAAALDEKGREYDHIASLGRAQLSALRSANARLVAGLEHLAKQQTPEEYEEAENDELDADTGLEAYERMVFAARESLARARELLGGK